MPFVIVVVSSDPKEPLAAAASVTWLHFALIVLGAGLAFLSRWRLLHENASGWTAAALLTIGLCLMPYALESATEMPVSTPPTSYPQVLCGLLVALFLRAAVRGVEPRGWRHPMLIGTVAGSLLALLPSVTTLNALDRHPVVVTLLLIMVTALILLYLMQLRGLPSWAIRLLGATLVFAMVWHHAVPFRAIDPTVSRLLILTCSAVASVLLLSTAMTLLREAIMIHDRRLVQLADRAARAEHDSSHDAELFHELRSTVAGIASASRLLDDGRDRLTGEKTVGLHRLLASEVRRLERMLRAPGNDAVPEGPEPLDLDALLEPLVIGLESQGAQVEHKPSGLTVHGRAERITEVVQALLSNATRHAPTAQVVLSSELSGTHVVLRIADNGPGIAPEVRTALFQRETKGPGSAGQGLGLYIAQRSIRDQGGELWLEDSHTGAVFNLRLPQMSGQ
ncbi:MAG: HAMP domain-containing histidine kinase [Nocardioides sp.]|nr:HAMP domain-containing histidine kinase [Nocardioides sp.]